MNKRSKIILSVCGLILLMFVTILVNQNSKETTHSEEVSNDDSSYPITHAKHMFDDPEFADAPSPEELELAQAEVLWPFALEKKPNRKEAVKEEWREFASIYPKNFYIPREMKTKLTESEEKEQLEVLDSFTAMDASFSSSIASSKWDGGNPPEAPSEKPAPKAQLQYFDYKINELESRIQMVEYWMQTKQPTASVKQNAEKDIAVWRKELSSLKEVRSQVPNT